MRSGLTGLFNLIAVINNNNSDANKQQDIIELLLNYANK